MFLKLNNYEVTIKVIGCVDGINQQNCISKEEISSLIVSTEGLMLSCMIEAMEVLDVETADIPGDFLQLIKTKETYISGWRVKL